MYLGVIRVKNGVFLRVLWDFLIAINIKIK